jgi:hypothetical protein
VIKTTVNSKGTFFRQTPSKCNLYATCYIRHPWHLKQKDSMSATVTMAILNKLMQIASTAVTLIKGVEL